MHFGGNANDGSNAGFVYTNSRNTPSNSATNISSHLYFSIGITILWEQRPCLLAKNILFRKVLVETSVVWTIERSEYEKQSENYETDR